MISVSDYIVSGLRLELSDGLAQYIEDGLDTVCAITGVKISEGIPWKRVIPPSTGEYLDLMHGMTFPYLSISAAIAFKGSWNMGSRLILEDGTMYHPYISADSADKSERTFWSSLVREAWPVRAGQNCLCIIAGDYKKKVWPRAAIGPLGPNTPVYLLDPDRLVSRGLVVNWQKLVDILNFVEEVYSAGFSKRAIGDSLYLDYAALMENGATQEWERRLSGLRALPEFSVSILIAQKAQKEQDEQSTFWFGTDGP